MSARRKTISVNSEWYGSRLDRFVRAVLPGLSFPAAQALIRKRRVLLNGSPAAADARLCPGDVVTLAAEPAPPAKQVARSCGPETPDRTGAGAGQAPGGIAAPDSMAPFGRIGREIAVLYEDDDLLLIDKPAGLPVQPGNRARHGSLLDLLAAYAAERTAGGSGRAAAVRGGGNGAARAARVPDRKAACKTDPGPGPPPYMPAPVHRLDRGTSGVLAVAKSRRAARALSRTFASGKAEKTYLAVVEGVPDPPNGRINTPLRIEKGARSRAVASPVGALAETAYRLAWKLPGRRALLEVRITTGRTHQIRAHLASIGHPLCGDTYYGARGARGRLMLHAWRLAFPHPVSGRPIAATAPPPAGFEPCAGGA